MKQMALIILAVLIIIGLSTILWAKVYPIYKSKPSVTINGHTFTVAIAKTPSQQQKGLGGVTHLTLDQGMYFPLDPNQTPEFWMKGMLIPIDIIWIKDNKIAGIDANVPYYPPNTPDSQLPAYQSPVTNPTAVLEVAANRSNQLGLKPGDSVIVSGK